VGSEDLRVKPLALPLLADENVHPDVVAARRAQGRDVATVVELGLVGAADRVVLRRAVADGRVVLTHDADFGALAVHAGEPIVGIVYVRPGHISPLFVLEALASVDRGAVEVEVPFVVVAERHGDSVRVRVRQLPVPP
jgi:predicted nuclease of predicted toxin-antitoxin system